MQTFSGGVDGAFTTIRHVSKAVGRRAPTLTGAVMVHGFDIPPADEASHRAPRERGAPLPADLGVELIPRGHRTVALDEVVGRAEWIVWPASAPQP